MPRIFEAKKQKEQGLGGGRSKVWCLLKAHTEQPGLFPNLMMQNQKASVRTYAGSFGSLEETNSDVEMETGNSRNFSKGVALDEPSGGFSSSIFSLPSPFSWEVRNEAGDGLRSKSLMWFADEGTQVLLTKTARPMSSRWSVAQEGHPLHCRPQQVGAGRERRDKHHLILSPLLFFKVYCIQVPLEGHHGTLFSESCIKLTDVNFTKHGEST